MAWIYLAESGDSPPPYHHGSDRSPTVKTTDTRSLCCCRECMIGNFLSLRYGTTLHRSLAPCYQMEKSTSSTADSPARTSALWELKRAWKENEAVFSTKSCALRPISGRLSSFLKTSQEVFERSNHKFSRHSKKSDTRRALLKSPHLASVPIKKGFAGFVWPTVTTKSYGFQQGGGSGRRVGKKRLGFSRLLGGPPNPEFLEWLMGFPIGWTAIEPWAMQWCQRKPGKRSKS